MMQRKSRVVFRIPFVIRITRVAKGHSILRSGKRKLGRRRKMTREQFEALIERESQVKHSIMIELFGSYYELSILRKPH
jgi:hypothetical protein